MDAKFVVSGLDEKPHQTTPPARYTEASLVKRFERWTPLAAEFRRDGFYERFPARGQVERVEKIRDRLRREAGL